MLITQKVWVSLIKEHEDLTHTVTLCSWLLLWLLFIVMVQYSPQVLVIAVHCLKWEQVSRHSLAPHLSKIYNVYMVSPFLVCGASCCSPRNGGRPCVGVRTRYKTCNTQKCAVDHVIVQKQNQCQDRNSHWTTLNNGKYSHIMVHTYIHIHTVYMHIADVVSCEAITIESSTVWPAASQCTLSLQVINAHFTHVCC